jgi:hypothetical protein
MSQANLFTQTHSDIFQLAFTSYRQSGCLFPIRRGGSTCPDRKMSDKNLEQQINTEFCMKIGKCASETLALLTLTYNENTMKKLSVFE